MTQITTRNLTKCGINNSRKTSNHF